MASEDEEVLHSSPKRSASVRRVSISTSIRCAATPCSSRIQTTAPCGSIAYTSKVSLVGVGTVLRAKRFTLVAGGECVSQNFVGSAQCRSAVPFKDFKGCRRVILNQP